MRHSIKMKEYTEIERDAIREIDKFDVDDYLAFGPNYFSCGWKKNTYYNYNYAVALALIGHFYGDEDCSNSDYHKGVKYIADAVGVSNRMVKILRKKLKHKNGYWFKTPYKTAKIIQKVIDKLRECEQENNVNDFLKKCDCTGYREILIAEQFVAIKKASEGRRKKVVKLADDLKNITDKVGDNA